jgi:hypothetical protein
MPVFSKKTLAFIRTLSLYTEILIRQKYASVFVIMNLLPRKKNPEKLASLNWPQERSKGKGGCIE